MSELQEVRLKISSVEKDINDTKKDANDAKKDGNTPLFLLLQQQLASLQQQLASLQQQLVLLLQKEERMDATAAATGKPAASVAMMKFWMHLPKAEVEPGATVKPGTGLTDSNLPIDNLEEEGNFLSLSDGSFFLGEEPRGNKLLVRDSYVELWDIVLELQGRKVNKVAITGSPGIGKSYFLYFVMHELAKMDPKPVVVLQIRQNPIYCFKNDDVLIGTSTSDFHEFLDKTETWYLVDGTEPTFYSAQTLLVSSPNPTVYNNFLKQPGSTQRYMPVWSKEEIQTCRKHVFAHLSSDFVDILYEDWGGRPRYVLEKANDSVSQSKLPEALGKSIGELWTVVSAVQAEGKPDSASDMLLEIRVSPNYDSYMVGFASSKVAEDVTKMILREKMADVKLWWESTENLGTASAAVRGVFYERLAHCVLQKGGKFECRDLSTGEGCEVELDSNLGWKSFSRIEEVQTFKYGIYAKPRAPNLAAVDALVQPDKMFQMTISSDHPINREGLERAMQVLHHGDPAYYFAVPPSIYNDFKPQKITKHKSASNKRSREERSEKRSRQLDLEIVHQFVIKVSV